MSTLLELDRVSLSFRVRGGLFARTRRLRAVEDVSLNLERGRVLAQRDLERRHGRTLRGDKTLLLRHIKLGCGANHEALADQRQNAFSGR